MKILLETLDYWIVIMALLSQINYKENSIVQLKQVIWKIIEAYLIDDNKEYYTFFYVRLYLEEMWTFSQ